jgi:hypothetical protein
MQVFGTCREGATPSRGTIIGLALDVSSAPVLTGRLPVRIRSKIVYVSVRVRARVLSGRLAGQAMPGFFAKEIVPQCAVWGAFPQPSATLKEPVGETASRLAYTQKSSERHVHGLPCYCSSKRTESFIYSTPWMRAECRSVTGQ